MMVSGMILKFMKYMGSGAPDIVGACSEKPIAASPRSLAASMFSISVL